MLVIIKNIRKILHEKNISQNELARKINYKHGTFGKFMSGGKPFPVKVIESMASILEVSKEEIKGWILADKYSNEVFNSAIKAKKEKLHNDSKLILTSKIDEILQIKNLSRTQLSKLAKYDQSAVNKMITGKESLSKTVLTKLSNVLDISEDEIISWILADKYSLKALETAIYESEKTNNTN